MQYQAHFERRHKSKTRTVQCGEDSFELARSELMHVLLDVDYDPLASGRQIEFINTASALLESAQSAEWGPAVYKGAHETRESPPLPKRLTREDSPAYQLALAQAKTYRTLYGDDECAVYRVWEHWFSTSGGVAFSPTSGLMIEHCDIGTERDSLEAQLAKASAILATPLTAEEAAIVESDLALTHYPRIEAFPPVRVHMYPISRNHAAIFSVPDNVETSFLTAAVDLCEYFLSRPSWECCAYSPAMRAPDGAGVYERDLEWRSMTLADGATYQSKIEDAYAELIVYKFRARLLALGFEDHAHASDYRLPPQWVPPMKDSPEVIARQTALAHEIIDKILGENAGTR